MNAKKKNIILTHDDYLCRRGEEHSFILKLASAINGDSKGNGEIMYSRTNAAPSNTHMMSNSSDGMMVSCTAKQFAILVSCHCNYTGTTGTLDDIIA